MDREVYPLLPWLHSSETCEHVFGECRKILKDFTYLDFLYMVPRLHILIREVVKFGHSSDPKARAAGYAHTYYDAEHANLATLAIFPTDKEIENAAKAAWEEADGLFTTLGVSPLDFMHSSNPTPDSSRSVGLPSIGSWFPAGRDPVFDHKEPDNESNEDEEEIADEFKGDEEEDEEETDAALLQRLIDDDELAEYRSTEIDDQMLSLTCAAIAVEVDEGMQV